MLKPLAALFRGYGWQKTNTQTLQLIDLITLEADSVKTCPDFFHPN